ncbi:hypothetical protein [Streptomyces lavendulae]|uniref:hypothetical protein n=1 Tax=Streptomyces lavendulae TaxID=1914 RepID=UPI003680EED7
MTYRLRNGGSVQTFRVGNRIEFVTKTADGRTISSVQRTFAEAFPLLSVLEKSNA